MSEPTFDSDGYPTDETCVAIESWEPSDPVGLFRFIESAWNGTGTVRRDGWNVELVTGGWSGNEDLVRAFKTNEVAWSLCWESSHRGGLHRFEIPENFRK